MNLLRELFLKYIGQTSTAPYLLEIEKSDGVFLYTPQGEKLFDLISGVSVSSLGHNFKPIVEAVKKQIESYSHLMVYGEFIQSPQVKLAEYLVKMLPEKLNNVYFVNSGSEAVEAAIKLAKRYTGKTRIVSFKNAYHGSSHGALSLCGNENFKNSFRPLLPEVYHIQPDNFAQLEIIDKNTACVIFEPVMAEAGIVIPSKEYIRELVEKCKKYNCLIVVDEIQTGFGRTGDMFGFLHYGFIPDIICFAKAFGGGMPLGAIVANKEIMHSFTSNPVLGHITTFGGHPVCSAASLEAIKYINESGIVLQVSQKEKLFRDLLSGNKHIKEIRGRGLLLAVELGDSYKVMKLVRKGLEIGFVTDWFIFHDTAFRIAPPLTISNQEIEQVCDLIKKALAEIFS